MLAGCSGSFQLQSIEISLASCCWWHRNTRCSESV
jgi:hypothetical protein